MTPEEQQDALDQIDNIAKAIVEYGFVAEHEEAMLDMIAAERRTLLEASIEPAS